MAMLNSEERQLDDFVRLGNAAGLKFEKLWDFGEMGLVEYRLPAWEICCRDAVETILRTDGWLLQSEIRLFLYMPYYQQIALTLSKYSKKASGGAWKFHQLLD